MTDHPQRPTERMALYDILTNRQSWTMNNPAITLHSYQDKQAPVVIIHTRTPLWFDPDEDVEIENPTDESPDYDQ